MEMVKDLQVFNQVLSLKNGTTVPGMGFGTCRIEDEKIADIVEKAVGVGYRHIDTGSAYGNERGVGKGIRNSGIAREDIFLTTKAWPYEMGYDNILRAFDGSMNRLGLDYVDLYLVHFPVMRDHYEDWQDFLLKTWRAFEKIYNEGRAKAIGVSNFTDKHLAVLQDHAEVSPVINQIEFHPGWTQFDTLRFCAEHDIAVSAWSPLGQGALLQSPVLKAMAAKYEKSVAQLILRWVLQHNVLPIVESKNPNRMKENTEIFDFSISSMDMKVIDELPPLLIGPHADNGYMLVEVDIQ